MALFVDNSLAAKVVRTDENSLRFKPGATTEAVLGRAAGYQLARGTVTGTANLSAATGLGTVVSAVVSPWATTGTAINTAHALTVKVQASTPGTIAIKRWKRTSNTNGTLVAATVAGTASYIAVGTHGAT